MGGSVRCSNVGLHLYRHPSLDEGSGTPVCLDTHLPGPGGSGEELELPTGLETLTALRDGEGGGGGGGSG